MMERPLNINGAGMALKVQNLLKALIECMTQETMALKAHNQDIATKMSAEKTRLMMTYKVIAAELHNNPTILKQADDDIRAQLGTLMDEFEIVLKDNMTTIQAGRGAISRLINRLLNKVRETVCQTSRNYNEHGELVEKRSQRPMQPTQLNEIY